MKCTERASWPETAMPGFEPVRSLIKRIRKKFHTIDPEFCSIESYPGFGYHWRASGS
jgi:hypothetical protein